MSWQSLASAPRGGTAIHCLLAFALVATLSVAAIVPTHAVEPDEPEAPTFALDYEPILEGYEHIEIVKKPVDWRAANDLAEQLDGPRGQLLAPGAMPQRKATP